MSWWEDPSDPMYQATASTGTPAAWAVRQGNKPVTDPVTPKDQVGALASWMTGGSQAHLFPYGAMRVVYSNPTEQSLVPRVVNIITALRDRLPGIGRLEDKFDYSVRPTRPFRNDDSALASAAYDRNNPMLGMPVRIRLGNEVTKLQPEEAAPYLFHEMVHPHIGTLPQELIRRLGMAGYGKTPAAAREMRASKKLYPDPQDHLEELATILLERNVALKRFGWPDWP